MNHLIEDDHYELDPEDDMLRAVCWIGYFALFVGLLIYAALSFSGVCK